MKALYDALNTNSVGLLESPTGTGKTLSLICGSLQWLHDIREGESKKGSQSIADEEEDLPDWMLSHIVEQQQRRQNDIKKSHERRKTKAKQYLTTLMCSGTEEEEEYLLDDWISDDDAPSVAAAKKRGASGLINDTSDSEAGADNLEEPKKPQIIFASRTHSQLTQFVGELHRTPHAESTSLVALASRKALCINENVLKLHHPQLINERCLELQKTSTTSKSIVTENGIAKKIKKAKCPFLAVDTKVVDMILASAMDIEDLAKLGKRKHVCPYYAARQALPKADVILAPYASLLVEDTRDSLGLDVTDSIIIIDEAHNLSDAINGAHSAELSGILADVAAEQLISYHQRFQGRLTHGNQKHIQTLTRIAQALAKFIHSGDDEASRALRVNDFLFSTGLDNINMFKLVRYVRESKIIFKVSGYWQSQKLKELEGIQQPSPIGNTGALHSVISFIQALNNEDADGRVILDRSSRALKFVLLNAAAHFSKVIRKARAVILASGTLSPLDPVLSLFPETPREKIVQYSCGHVIGPERLLALAVGSGPSGKALDFRHAVRTKPSVMDELGRLLVNASRVVPGGVVVFFPSFSYADAVYACWKSSGVLQQLSNRKKVFQEPRSTGDVESILTEYTASCREQGAIMLCVIGAKLSEGINFGDQMGRCVIVVGLPYPNPSDPELQERLKFADGVVSQEGPYQLGHKARQVYQDMCMKAVNQCVGRVIRHKDDYATIILADVRWAESIDSTNRPRPPLSKLPGWIKDSLQVVQDFGDAQVKLVRFFKAMMKPMN